MKFIAMNSKDSTPEKQNVLICVLVEMSHPQLEMRPESKSIEFIVITPVILDMTLP